MGERKSNEVGRLIDVSGRGTQAPAVQAPKHKHQHRRLSSNANFRPDPSSRKCPSVGISKASNGNEPEVR